MVESRLETRTPLLDERHDQDGRLAQSVAPKLDGDGKPLQSAAPSPAVTERSQVQRPDATSHATAGSLDRAGLESLIAKSYAGLRLLIAKRAGSEELAADLLNEAICTTWQKWEAGRIQRPEQLAGYVFQVAMNLLRNHRRAMAERADIRAGAAALDALPARSEASLELEDRIAASVKALIRNLDSPRDRTVLVRFYLDEEDREVICQDLHLTAPQFARILHRARGRLRRLLEASGYRRSDLFCLGLLA